MTVCDGLIAAIRSRLALDAPPRSIQNLAEEVLQVDHSNLNAFELAAQYAPRLKTRLTRLRQEQIEAGIDPWFDFNSSSPHHIQGPCFVEPRDLPEVKAIKQNRLRAQPMRSVLESLSFEEFETVCVATLSLLGARDCHLTKRTRDQGIDFFGQLFLGDLEPTGFPFVRFQDDLKLWIIGQAKHYVGGKVSTPEIRNLVGSVNLARFKEYASTTELMSELPMRSCDPVLVLFLTTGTFTRDAKRLALNSGAILKDVGDLSKFLADRCVGAHVGQDFNKEHLLQWAQDKTAGVHAATSDEQMDT